MPSDYDLIATEHRAGYGTFDHHIDAWEDFYADDLHFVYELIQNAQDAIGSLGKAASRRGMLGLILRDGELLALNDGVPFAEKHVRAICSIRQSTKDLSQVGTHGIGFKATGKFTDCPEIYSGSECFRIRRKVEPSAVDHISDEIAGLVRDGFTVFRLAFKTDLPEGSIVALADRFRHIHKWSLLFLHDLHSVEWADQRTGNQAAGKYERVSSPHNTLVGANVTTLRSEVSDGTAVSERFLCFSRHCTPPDWVIDDLLSRARDMRERDKIKNSAAFAQPIEVAFRINDDGAIAPLVGDSSVLFSYLPTTKDTNLRFLIQARFKTTFARDNIINASTFPWNRWLLSEIAAFLPEILKTLANEKLLTPATLRVLPIPKEEVPDGEGNASILGPILASCISALAEHSLIPTEVDGEYEYAARVFRPHNPILRRLLTSLDLAALIGTNGAVWLHSGVRWEENDEGALLRAAGVKEVRSPQIVSWLLTKDAKWFEAKDEQWLASLYQYLASIPTAEQQRLVSVPLARIENGKHVCGKTDWVFFPPSNPEEEVLVAPFLSILPQFSSSLLAHASEADGKNVSGEIRSFLTRLLVEPLNLLRLIKDWLLPQYAGETSFTAEENIAHVRFMHSAMERLPVSDAKQLAQAAKEVPFLRCVCKNHSHDISYKSPQEVYIPAHYTGVSDLEVYFGTKSEAWFITPNYLDFQDESHASDAEPARKIAVESRISLLAMLKQMGCAVAPRILTITNATLSEEFKERIRAGEGFSYERGAIDYTLDGIDAALATIQVGDDDARVASLALWRLLLVIRSGWSHDQKRFATGKYTWFYYSDRTKTFVSTLDTKLKSTPWILCEDKTFAAPQNVYVPLAETRRVLGGYAKILNPELDVKDDQRSAVPRQLAQALGVRFTVDVPTAIRHLEQLSGTAPDVAATREVYALLEARNMQSEENRALFAAKPLLYTPTPEPRWWKAGEVFWQNENSAFGQTRGYLEDHYPTALKSFFISVNVSETAAFPDYARAVLELEKSDADNEATRERAYALYSRLQNAVNERRTTPSTNALQAAEAHREVEKRNLWNQLMAARCWLGRQNQDQWAWHERAQLFLNDHDFNTSLFIEHLPFWTAQEQNLLARLVDITPASQARIEFRPSELQEEQPTWTEKLRAIAGYIASFLASPKLVGEQYATRSLDFFNDVRVVLALEAEVTYSLGGVAISDPQPLTSHLEVSDCGGIATIYITSEAAHSEVPDLIGDALAVYFGAMQIGGFVSRLLSADKIERVLSHWQKLGLRYEIYKAVENVEEPQPRQVTSEEDAETVSLAHQDDASPNNGVEKADVSSKQPSTSVATQRNGLFSDTASDESNDRTASTSNGTKSALELDKNKPADPHSNGAPEPPTPSDVISISTPDDDGRKITASDAYKRSVDSRHVGASIGNRGYASGSSGRSNGYGGGGPETDTHIGLKLLIRDDPERLGYGLRFVQLEYGIAGGLAGSIVDVLLKDEAEQPVCVECKPYIRPHDYSPVWQAIRYKHLLAVEHGVPCAAVRAILVAPQIPADVQAKCSLMGVEFYELGVSP